MRDYEEDPNEVTAKLPPVTDESDTEKTAKLRPVVDDDAPTEEFKDLRGFRQRIFRDTGK